MFDERRFKYLTKHIAVLEGEVAHGRHASFRAHSKIILARQTKERDELLESLLEEEEAKDGAITAV